MKIKQALVDILSDRAFVVTWLMMMLVLVVVLVNGALSIRATNLQIPIRYTSYGVAHFYRDKWYYLINFMVFVSMVTMLHTVIAIKLRSVKDRVSAIGFLGLGVVILLVAAVYFSAIFRVVSLTQ